MRGVALALALLAPLAARAQTPATTASGQDVLLYDDGSWIDADAALPGLRDGQRLSSASRVYDLYVPTGWMVSKSKGSLVDGEFYLEHGSTGASAIVSFLSRESLGMSSLPLSPTSGVAMFWGGMREGAVHAERGEPRLSTVGGHRMATLDGEVRFAYEPTMAFRLTAHTDPRGMVVLVTLVAPLDRDAAAGTLDRLHQSLAIRPAEVEGILQQRADERAPEAP